MKKFSNKILIVTLVVLVSIFVLSKIFRSPKLESNLRKELVLLDTAAVTEVRVKPAIESGKEIKLVRNGNKWKVMSEGKEAEAEGGTVESMLGVMMNLRAQRMVTRKEDKWENFEVGETSTRVTVFEDNDKQTDFRVGKTGFDQSQGQGRGMSGAYTYIRMTDEDEVYSSEGFIGSHFNRSFNDWRNKAFLRVAKDDVTKVQFSYPDSSFVLEKRDSIWYLGNLIASQTKVDQYFNKIRFKNISGFEDGIVQQGNPTLILQISGAAGELATARAWPKDDEEWILNSSIQDGVYFSGKRSTEIKDIFPGRGSFIE